MNLFIYESMAEFRPQLYTCELCGEDGFKEEDLRSDHFDIIVPRF